MSIPRLAITLGDVAGIGPEIVVKAWPRLCEIGALVVYGDVFSLQRAIQQLKGDCRVVEESHPANPHQIPCRQCTRENLESVQLGKVCREAGQAAYDFLVAGIEAAQKGIIDAIVTAPLHKEGLRAADLHYPGHTEILAEKTNTPHYAMVLYGDDLAVAHVTLHCALRDVFAKLSTEAVLEKSGCCRIFFLGWERSHRVSPWPP